MEKMEEESKLLDSQHEKCADPLVPASLPATWVDMQKKNES